LVGPHPRGFKTFPELGRKGPGTKILFPWVKRIGEEEFPPNKGEKFKLKRRAFLKKSFLPEESFCP